MKKAIIFIYVFIQLFAITSCLIQTRQDKVLSSIGKYDSKQFWTNGDFQDCTDFGIYSYSTCDAENNKYFAAISESDIEIIGSFIDDFEAWIDVFRNNNPDNELVLNYVFDRSIIDTEDYFYIYEGENYPKYGCYDVWFFDSQSNVLYYFHNNIQKSH